MPVVWLNGKFVDEADACVSLRDTGLLHGAGVFTTMRSYRGIVVRLNAHVARLRQSCEALSIPLLPRDELIHDAVEELLGRNDLTDARLRLTVTRGSAQEDPEHGLRLTPNVFLTAVPVAPYPLELYARGMTVVVLDDQKLNPYDLQAGHKTLNYLSRLAALRDANGRGAGEAMWFNVHNYLQGGSISNVFIVKGGELLTPPTPAEMLDPAVAEMTAYPKSAVLPGITRGVVMELAREAKIGVRLTSITVNDLLEADEVFLTNSIMAVMPVGRVERRAIGTDKPGEITRQLSKAYDDRVRAESGE